MKTLLLLFVSLSLAGCQNSKWARTGSRSKAVNALTFPESVREEKLRSLRNETDARAKTYEKRGYSPAEARAVAEAEYFRSGR
jgi:hypothetical protein